MYPPLARWGESTVSHDVGTHRARLNELIQDMVSPSLRYFPFISGHNLSDAFFIFHIDVAWWGYPTEVLPQSVHMSFRKSGMRLLLAGTDQ